jgi:hypothetical protein
MGSFPLIFDWQHSVLLGGAILGGVLVGVGILKDSKEWSVGAVLVLIGVVIEPIFTIGLFLYDESVSRDQKATIVQLLSRRVLSPEQKELIAQVANRYPSLTFLTVTTPEDEPWGFVMELAALLKSDGWTWAPCVDANGKGLKPLDPRPSSCETILVGVQINAPDNLKDAAEALADAIREPSVIGMDDVRVVSDPNATTMMIMAGSKR